MTDTERFDNVLRLWLDRIDDDTGEPITAEAWDRYEWEDVTSTRDPPGLRRFLKGREIKAFP